MVAETLLLGAAGIGQAGGLGGISKGKTSGDTFIDPTQKGYLDDLFKRASDFSQQSTFTGFNPLQLAGQQQSLNFAGGIQPFLQNAQNTSAFLTNPNLLNPNSNPFLGQSAQAAINPLLKSLQEDILPQIGADAIGTGNFNSTRKGVGQGIAVDRFLQNAGDITSNIFSNAYGQGLNTLTQNLGLAPGIAQAGLLPSDILQNLGGQQRQLEQERLLDPFTQLQRFQGLLGAPIELSKQRGQTRSGSGVVGALDSVGSALGSFGKSLGL